MDERWRNRWALLVFRGVMAIVFGVVALAWPSVTVLALAIVWGIYAIMDGFTGIGIAVFGRNAATNSRVMYGLVGFCALVSGFIALVWPGVVVLALLLIIAIWAIIGGIVQIMTAIRLRGVLPHDWLLAATGSLTVLLGILLVARPRESLLALAITTGIFALLWGGTLIGVGVRLRGRGQVRRRRGLTTAR